MHSGSKPFREDWLSTVQLPERVRKRERFRKIPFGKGEVGQQAWFDWRRIQKAGFRCNEPHAKEKRERPHYKSQARGVFISVKADYVSLRQAKHTRRVRE